MKLYFAILAVIMSSISMASGMNCGGEVTKKITAEQSSVRELITQKNDQEKKYLFVSKVSNEETGSLSYSGVIGDLIYDEKTRTYDIVPEINQTWLGDFDDKDTEGYKRLEALWSELNLQVKS